MSLTEETRPATAASYASSATNVPTTELPSHAEHPGHGESALPEDKKEEALENLEEDWEDDPLSPRNWSFGKKWTAVSIFHDGSGSTGGAIRYGITDSTTLAMTLSIFLLSFALGVPLLAQSPVALSRRRLGQICFRRHRRVQCPIIRHRHPASEGKYAPVIRMRLAKHSADPEAAAKRHPALMQAHGNNWHVLWIYGQYRYYTEQVEPYTHISCRYLLPHVRHLRQLLQLYVRIPPWRGRSCVPRTRHRFPRCYFIRRQICRPSVSQGEHDRLRCDIVLTIHLAFREKWR
ncbi:multidrug resistance protein [Salix suchowensis]|nr:multidrug resistance protein [Salix suchowensis]